MIPPNIKRRLPPIVNGNTGLDPKVRNRSVEPRGAPGGPSTSRRPRADAKRNRDRLLEAAKSAFGDVGANAALGEIARRAGVGIGTLYRHFPTRNALLEAVYRREVERLSAAAGRLLDTLRPIDALHEWMRLSVDYIATKKVMASALGSIVGGTNDLYAVSGAQIVKAVSLLVERAIASEEIRPDARPGDILRALVGFMYGSGGADWQASALRLIDILVAGLRSPIHPNGGSDQE